MDQYDAIEQRAGICGDDGQNDTADQYDAMAIDEMRQRTGI